MQPKSDLKALARTRLLMTLRHTHADQDHDFWSNFQCAGLCGQTFRLRIYEWSGYCGIFNRHVYAALKRERPDLVYCRKCRLQQWINYINELAYDKPRKRLREMECVLLGHEKSGESFATATPIHICRYCIGEFQEPR